MLYTDMGYYVTFNAILNCAKMGYMACPTKATKNILCAVAQIHRDGDTGLLERLVGVSKEYSTTSELEVKILRALREICSRGVDAGLSEIAIPLRDIIDNVLKP